MAGRNGGMIFGGLGVGVLTATIVIYEGGSWGLVRHFQVVAVRTKVACCVYHIEEEACSRIYAVPRQGIK